MLRDLDVIVIDCQTTGSTPERGDLLEVAWRRNGSAESRLVALPDGGRIPRRVTRLTGIRQRDLKDATPPTVLAAELAEASAGALAVAHFARFERAFLEPRLGRDWICTHEIVCRLIPGLPRRSLRAVAGYFGHVMGESKRAAAHVRATTAIWTALVERLAGEGVGTLEQLRDWLRRTEPARRTGKEFPLAREKRLSLPDRPGVYRMLGKGGEVLYLGKAKSLKRRVNAHFTSHGNKELLTQAWNVDVEETGSALEAAVREADEIKEHAPPYNVALRAREAVWFASENLRSVCRRPNRRHACGPLPDRDAVAALVALSAPPPFEEQEAWERALGFRQEPRDLHDGFALFAARYEAHTPRDLMRLGARLWIRTPDGHEADERDEVPKPERVATMMEASVRRAAHFVRRARWLTRLSEASLEWSPRGGGASRLSIHRGRVTAQRPDFARPERKRLACFDPATYDRLRVLTTELRRLVAERRDVSLRIGPRLRLDRAGLARRLRWV